MSKIVGFETYDVRFPTSRTHDGSDAMNRNPDYASAYVIVRTDAQDGLAGHGFVSRSAAATRSRSRPSARSSRSSSGATSMRLLDDLGGLSRELVGDSHLRWLGPGARRHAHGDRRGAQRLLGHGRATRGKAAVAIARRAPASADRRADRLSLPRRRAHASRRRSICSSAAARGASSVRRRSSGTATRPTRRRRVARLRGRAAARALRSRRWRTASSSSRSRSADGSRRPAAVCDRP